MNKKAKKVIKEYKPQTERDRFTVVLEDIQSDFKVFGEHLELVETKLDAHIIQTDANFEKIDRKFEEINHQFDQVGKQFDQVGKEFEFVKGELGIIRNDLKEKISREEFRLLETKVMDIERRLNKR